MKKILVIAFAAMALAGCATKGTRIMNIQAKCDAVSPEPQDFYNFVTCMKSGIAQDESLASTPVVIKYVTMADRLSARASAGDISLAEAQWELDGYYRQANPRARHRRAPKPGLEAAQPVSTISTTTPASSKKVQENILSNGAQ